MALRSLNPFRKVTRVVNRAPFEVTFMVSRIPMPPEGNAINQLHLVVSKRIRSGREIEFDPLILDRGPQPLPQYVFVVDTNNAGQLVAPYFSLSTNILRSHARVVIELDQNARVLYAQPLQGGRIQRAKAVVKFNIARKRLKNLFVNPVGTSQLYQEEPPNPPQPPPPPPSPDEAAVFSTSTSSSFSWANPQDPPEEPPDPDEEIIEEEEEEEEQPQ